MKKVENSSCKTIYRCYSCFMEGKLGVINLTLDCKEEPGPKSSQETL